MAVLLSLLPEVTSFVSQFGEAPMAWTRDKLTALQVRTAKPGAGVRELCYGNLLQLWITPKCDGWSGVRFDGVGRGIPRSAEI